MASSNEIQNTFFENEVDSTSSPSIDDFIRELEAKEHDLQISIESVEISDYDIEIDDNFVPTQKHELESPSAPKSLLKDKKEKHSSTARSSQSAQTGDLAKVQKDQNELVDSIKRLQNDFVNYRKRTERERSETFRNQLSNLATKMLPVLDNLNRALDVAGKVDSKAKDFALFLEGVMLVNQQLNDVLGEMGIEEIPSVGHPFDPELHEAVAIEAHNGHPPNTVIEEMLRGYRIDTKVIRHSMVKVSAAVSSPAKEPTKAIE